MKLTIITINLNNLNGLKNTIESVKSQTFLQFEYIIIDGKSNDGSVDFIKNECGSFARVISEPDTGIYNAMNKGIYLAKGEYIQFLNSGDRLSCKKTLENLFSIIDSRPDIDFFYSDVIMKGSNKIYSYPSDLSFEYFYNYTINHQATIFKRNLFLKHGYYSEKYIIVSDWEFYLKILFIHRCKFLWVQQPIVEFDFKKGVSTSKTNKELILSERKTVLNELFPYFILDYEKWSYIQRSTTWKFIKRLNAIKKYILR